MTSKELRVTGVERNADRVCTDIQAALLTVAEVGKLYV